MDDNPRGPRIRHCNSLITNIIRSVHRKRNLNCSQWTHFETANGLYQQKKPTMGKAEEYQEIILQTEEWFDKKIKQLQLVIDKKDDSKILFKDKEGGKVELPEDMKKGFYFGIQTAIEVLGKFPVKITKS